MLIEVCVLLASLFFVVYFIKRRKLKTLKSMPPGPWAPPILGHLALFGAEPHKVVDKWSKEYGPLMTLQLGSFQTVVISDGKIMRQAFNSPIFSGRGQIQWLLDGTGGKGITYGDTSGHLEQREFVLKSLRDFGMGRNSMESKIQDELLAIIESIKGHKGQPVGVNHMFSVPVINCLCSMLIGQRFEMDDKQIHHFSFLISDQICNSDSILNKLSMFLPWIGTYMGKASGYDEKVAVFREIQGFLRPKLLERKKTWVRGQPRDVTDAYFDKVAETTDPTSSFYEKNDWQPISFGDVFIAGAETVGTSMSWLILLMASHSDLQQKLQAEIDEVVGQGRIPSLNDRPNMPYTDALIHELNRYSALVPWGMFRRTMQDVDLQGYHIPKGTMVMANQYSVLYNKDFWGDPEVFRPERFLEEDSQNKKRESSIAFGTGRRMCLGFTLGMDELFLFITGLFQNFTVEFPKEDPPVDTMGVFGFTLSPKDFRVKFIERSAN